MGNLINSGGRGELMFRGKKKNTYRQTARCEENAAFLVFSPVLRSKTGTQKNPELGAAPKHPNCDFCFVLFLELGDGALDCF